MIILGPQYLFVGRPCELFAPECRAFSRAVLNQARHLLIQANIVNIHAEEQENIEVPKITSNLSALGQDRLVLHMEGIMLYSCFFFFHSIFNTVLSGHNWHTVRTTSDKQISRTFQGIFKDKLQFSRSKIYWINQHCLTPFDHPIV